MIKETPKSYLSYSQISCLDYSEQKYIQSYIYGQAKEENDFLSLGKEVHKELELRNKDSKLIDIINQIPEYQNKELKIKAQLEDIPLFGIIDGLNENPLILVDYKTGLKKNIIGWRNQLIFYNLMFWQSRKEIAKENIIYFIKTKKNENDQLILDGSVEKFDIKIDMQDVISFVPKVMDSWKRIKRLVERERYMFGELPFDK